MAKNLFFPIVCILVLSLAGASLASAQDSDCALAVMPRVQDGHAYFQIMATGFAPDADIQFSWWRRPGTQDQAQQQNTDSSGAPPETECATFGLSPASEGRSLRSAIGKDSDGNYCRVSPGTWEVRAQAGSCSTQTKFIVPVRATSGVPIGTWGGESIGVHVTDTISTIDLFCAVASTTEPLIVNSNGQFDVQGIYRPVKTGPSSETFPAHFTGSVDKDKMTLTMTAENVTQTFTLTLGQEASQHLPGCR